LRFFSEFFWNLFSFFVSYFYLIEGSKIFFVKSKYSIWVVHVQIYLWEFFYNFWNIWNIFRGFYELSS
jgi:hypothetical protein